MKIEFLAFLANFIDVKYSDYRMTKYGKQSTLILCLIYFYRFI